MHTNDNATRLFSVPLLNTPIPDKTGSYMEVGLNSPRSKFEITNMVNDQVDLTPEDIPGASFSEEEV